MLPEDERIINAVREQVKVDQEKLAELKRQNDLTERTVKTLERTLLTEKTRLQFWSNISEQTAQFLQQLPELILQLHGFAEKLVNIEEHLRDYEADAIKRLDRLEYGLMLILSGKGNGNKEKAEALLRDIEIERVRELLSKHQRVLHELEVAKSLQGINTPPHVLIQIEDELEEIKGLKKRLHEL